MWDVACVAQSRPAFFFFFFLAQVTADVLFFFFYLRFSRRLVSLRRDDGNSQVQSDAAARGRRQARHRLRRTCPRPLKFR